MKEQAPELFENHADLMHDLVTTLSPTVLMKNGIPVSQCSVCVPSWEGSVVSAHVHVLYV